VRLVVAVERKRPIHKDIEGRVKSVEAHFLSNSLFIPFHMDLGLPIGGKARPANSAPPGRRTYRRSVP